MGTTIALIISVLVLAGVMVTLVVRSLTEICQPNEVLILSGSRHAGRGYRLVHGGRTMRLPLFEKVDRLDLTNMSIDLRVKGAYSKGGIALNLNGVANVKIASEEPTISNAIERFLGAPRSHIVAVAKETLEGNLRGVLATLTPEEVNQDRVKFAESLLHEADLDLRRLGLALDMLKIQHVSDDVGYLDSIGRKQSADLQMRSRIAEAQNQELAAVRTAQNLQTKEIARINAKMEVAKAEAERRILDADTKATALVAEEEAAVAAELAKAHAELEVQRARLEQVKLQLLADRVRPAEAKRDQMLAQAKGAAASIVQDGKANARAIQDIADTWRNSGDSARQILVAQKLEGLLGSMMSTISDLPIEKVTLIDSELSGGNGDDPTVRATVASEKLKQTLGVDIPAVLNRLAPAR